MKIEKLTPKQEEKFPEYVKKWIEIGTNTDRLDRETTEKIVDSFRELINFPTSVPLIITKNPIEAWVVCCLWENKVAINDVLSEMKSVFHGNPKNHNIPPASLPYQTGSFFASIFSFYDYILEELHVDIDKDLYVKYKKWEQTSKIGCIYPLQDVTIVCEKPALVKLNDNNVIHCDGGAAVEYDGEGEFEIYALNGVVVPKYLAVTNSSNIDINLYNNEKNADVKAEFVRKVGIEKFLETGTQMDSFTKYEEVEHEWWYKSQYELWDMKSLFPSLDKAPFLKMLNPTTKIWHMEGVSPNCKTLPDAIKERFGGKDFVIRDAA